MGATFLTLLSGGLDSTVATTLALRDSGAGEALFFDYGQKAKKPELKASQAVAKRLGLKLRVVELPFLAEVTKTALVMNDQVIPQIKMSKLDDRSEAQKSAMQVWVPNRNGLFLNVAASLAESAGIREIVVGFNAEEAVTFPDNSANFLNRAEQFFALSTLTGVRVVAPTIGMNKSEIARRGLEAGAPLDAIWSCYRGGKKMCGTCESCLRAVRAFRSAGCWEGMRGKFERVGGE